MRQEVKLVVKPLDHHALRRWCAGSTAILDAIQDSAAHAGVGVGCHTTLSTAKESLFQSIGTAAMVLMFAIQAPYPDGSHRVHAGILQVSRFMTISL